MSVYPAPSDARKTLVVIGGGAAGFFCAVNAARLNPNLQVILLEKTSKLLSKVRISGGGRCNVTHALFDIAEMSRRYPRGQNFVKKTFHQFFTTDTIQWFEKRGVKLKAEDDGRMFPVSDSSQSIINCLMNEANICGVDIRLNAEVQDIKTEGESFQLVLSGTRSINCQFVCIAAGGYPKTHLFEWIGRLGHTIEPPVPSLFTFNLPGHPIAQLMGVSVDEARVRIAGTKISEQGAVLVTHWGLSGPAVLRCSAWGARQLAEKHYSFSAHINWLPQHNEVSLKEWFRLERGNHAAKKLLNHNFSRLPARLWQFLIEAAGIPPGTRLADLSSKAENHLIKNMVDYVVDVKGKTTFKEEFVTAGGVSLAEVDPNTMMSRKQKNLFFAGEVIDVDGITGGFNFQHAWTSGWIAAKNIAQSAR